MAERAATERDIAICGAGPVGSACALFLCERGIAPNRIALVDARIREAAAKDDRMIAISHGSATLLARIGAWRDSAATKATPITKIHISHRGRFGRTVIDRGDYRVPALGYVIRHGDLTEGLAAALTRRGIAVLRPMRVTGIAFDREAEMLLVSMVASMSASMSASTSRGDASDIASHTLHARHVIHAEGGLFDTQQRRAIHRDYEQTAITAFVTLAEKPGPALVNTAFERFTEASPIALLPARDAVSGRDTDGYALVWCGRPDEGESRLAMGDRDFLGALHAAFGDRLGRFASVGARRAYPLGLNAVEATARAHSPSNAEFAIGNAAQALHPVAGQGLNLGLRDAYVLAQMLAESIDPVNADHAATATALASRFQASRRADRAAIVGLTDFMPRVFANPLAPVAWGRGLTLALLDVAGPLRGVFARQMMNGRR